MKNSNFFPFERNRYFHGKMLTARDFETEQKYYNDKRRLVNRCVLGAGVVCGLCVYRNDESSLMIETGLALDYSGREIVLATPVIRKLAMIDGAQQLGDHEQAYLCLEYDEQFRESVNNIGIADGESEQYNKIEESYRLYLDTEKPDMETLYSAGGKNSVTALFSNSELSIYSVVPAVVLAGQSFSLQFVIIKAAGAPPLSFTYTLKSDYADGGMINITYNEDVRANRDIFLYDCPLKAAAVSNMQVPFGVGNALLSLNMGNLSRSEEIPVNNELYICETAESFAQMEHTHKSSLEKQLSGGATPIYLAKIDYAGVGGTFILRNVTPLPFSQRIEYVERAGGNGGGSGFASELFKGGSSKVEMLKYWQKPEVSVQYDAKSHNMNFQFGLPSSEAYDYATSSGAVDVPLSGAIRVNARYFSDEIPHNLGLGDVSLSFAVEFLDNNKRKLLFGNGDVFSAKSNEKAVPKVEVAGLLYPETGTFRVGVWCLDNVEGHLLRVRWFAYKPTRDTADMRAKEVVSLKIQPEIYKMKPMDRIHFEATVNGSSDKSVTWSIADPDGGKIDHNGLYQAPSNPGTYEIVAESGADAEAKTSAFVIVEV